MLAVDHNDFTERAERALQFPSDLAATACEEYPYHTAAFNVSRGPEIGVRPNAMVPCRYPWLSAVPL